MRRLSLLLLALALVSGCADTAAPTWNGDVALEASDVTAHTATLRWPAADDDNAVSAYRVLKDDELLERVAPTATAYEVEELSQGTTYAFTVIALDEAGNRSERLSVELNTLDGEAPAWPSGVGLTVQASEGGIDLIWPTPTDNVGVTGFRLLMDGTELASVESPATSHHFELEATEGRYEVLAGDEAGNWSGPLRGVLRPTEPALAEAPTEALPAGPNEDVAARAAAAAGGIAAAQDIGARPILRPDLLRGITSRRLGRSVNLNVDLLPSMAGAAPAQ